MSAADDGARGRGKKDQSDGGQPPVVKIGSLVGRSDVAAEEEVWEPGRVVLGLYEVGDELGKGGMGVVHKVRHGGWNHWMAVKSPRPEVLSGAGGKEDFVREAELWVNLPGHPNIVTCHYVRTIAGIPRIFAEYVDGGSLRDRIGGGWLRGLDGILDIAIQMAWGLALAHGEGLVHQDMKPGNVMLTSGGAAKITDFGLARARARAAGEDVAADVGGDAGVSARGLTKEYASPEQMAGERLSGKTDIWSWAVTVLDMFAGGVSCELGPAAGWTFEEYLKGGPQEGLPAMPEGLAGLLRRCFSLEPDERPTDFEVIAQELQELFREATGEAHSRQVPQKVDFLADGLNNRALSMLDVGKVDEAERLWEEALVSDPTHAESVYNLGLLRWRSARINDLELVRLLEEVRRAHSEDWTPSYLLSLVHLERYDAESAVRILEAIPEKQKARQEVASALGKARERPSGRRLLRTIEAHRGGVESVCLSTDGRCALSSGGRTLRLWDTDTGTCLQTFKGHTGTVNSVCLSADGRRALSGSEDSSLKLWSVATGECLRTFRRSREGVHAVCLSADGSYALSGSGRRGSFGDTLILWDVATARCVRSSEASRDPVLSVWLSTDARFALFSNDVYCKLLQVSTGELLQAFRGHTNVVTSVCLSTDGRYALSGSVDMTLKLWDVTTGDCVRTFEGHERSVESVCLSADQRYALSGSTDCTLKLWELNTGRCLRTFEGHKEAVTSVFLSADGDHAVSGSDDGTLKLWNVARDDGEFLAPAHLSMVVTGEAASQQERTFQGLLGRATECRARGDFVEAVRLVRQARSLPGYERSDHALAAWTTLYSCLRRSALREGWPLRTLQAHVGRVDSVCLSADRRYALTGSEDKTLKLWDVATGECVRTFEGHTSYVFSVCLSEDGEQALSGSADHSLRLWDVATGRCVRTFEGHRYEVEAVCLSVDGRYALSGSRDETVKLWEVATGRCLRTFERKATTTQAICTSADGRYVLCGGGKALLLGDAPDDVYSLRLWDIATGECQRTFAGHRSDVTSVCLSADGRYALSGSVDKTVKLWDVASGGCLRTFKVHRDEVCSVCFSADGGHALSGAGDGTLRVWVVATGECLRTFEAHEDGVQSACLSEDGRYALSGGLYDGLLKVWHLDWELEQREPADSDEGARPYLENFLTLHTPYLAELPQDREPTQDEVTLALTRGGRADWTEDEFRGLLYTLGCAGYGWLRPEGVRSRLEELSNSRE